ncbi:glycoside hydrolase family 15 protein [Actinocatenispora sera]|uniref:Glucoamylase n=1 Tax=Actinocatenispora sera TaxID=390989 RepID=A0A810KW33_9ACTN|nr:glycoside hydrolase family 15 protein [Actinocatenispora sera]BCJ26672.1 glucoamylase [Actinocatenispora sera]
MRIEDYALIGDLQTAALVGRNGSVDWLCLPRFDSAACFTALLGEPTHGRWLIGPVDPVTRISRRYRDGTLILETDLETADGAVRLIDFMPPREPGARPQLTRIVQGLRGRVRLQVELVVRFEYGSVVPWVQRVPDGVVAQAGPDALHLATSVPLHGHELTTVGEFELAAGGTERFMLTWFPPYEPPGLVEDAYSALARTERWWLDWSGRCGYTGAYADEVLRSLIVLKALTDRQTGAVVAAPTTSLPEDLGGERNWDYRYTWLRDSVLALNALLAGGYTGEARAFADCVFRATAGHPEQMQIMYGIAGERRLAEYELDHLPGYEGSRPVRVGNAAAGQFQLDVYGEVLGVAAVVAGHVGRYPDRQWRQQRKLLDYLDGVWQQPDDGMWESRGPRRHYTQSKLMAWVAFDRAVAMANRFGLDGPVEKWAATRDAIRAEILDRAWDPRRETFTQYYGSTALDAGALMIPLVGLLPGGDPRVTSTIDVVRAELGRDGLLSRYSTDDTDDGLPGTEGQFLACSFWLVDALAWNGRRDEARELFERLLGLANDVGLFAEEYDVRHGRQVGNFPQAFTHLALINAARVLSPDQPHPFEQAPPAPRSS